MTPLRTLSAELRLASALLISPRLRPINSQGDEMNRVLVIDQDRAATQALGLACLDRDLGIAIAENLCEGVRVLLTTAVDLIAVAAAEMRLTAREMATLFDRVAPGVPVVVAMKSPAVLDQRVTFELAGFRVIEKPVSVEELLHKVTSAR
jgi:DNA-binding response OmpR family regulator